MASPPYKTVGKHKDLHYAPHRFESTQVPLAELSVWIEAVIAVAHEIAVSKDKGSDARVKAQTFINGLDARALLLLLLYKNSGYCATRGPL